MVDIEDIYLGEDGSIQGVVTWMSSLMATQNYERGTISGTLSCFSLYLYLMAGGLFRGLWEDRWVVLVHFYIDISLIPSPRFSEPGFCSVALPIVAADYLER